MSKPKDKTVHIKKVTLTPACPDKFEDLLTEAVQTICPLAENRMHRERPDSDTYRLLNDFRVLNDIPSMTVFGFTVNANMHEVVMAQGKRALDINVVAPSKKNGRRSAEFLDGLVVAAAKDNHIAFMPNKMISLGTLENYFSWLITKSKGTPFSVTFSDPPVDNFRNSNMSGVKSINILNQSHTAIAPNARTTATKIYKPSGNIYKMISAILSGLGSDALPAEQMQQISSYNSKGFDMIELALQIKLKRRGAYEESAAVVEKMAEAFRDVPNPNNIEFEFGDGRKISLDKLRISTTIRVEYINDLPVITDAESRLRTWLTGQLEQLGAN